MLFWVCLSLVPGFNHDQSSLRALQLCRLTSQYSLHVFLRVHWRQFKVHQMIASCLLWATITDGSLLLCPDAWSHLQVLYANSHGGFRRYITNQGRYVGQGLCAHSITTFHSIVHSDIQEVCGSNRIVTALVLKFTRCSGVQLLYWLLS